MVLWNLPSVRCASDGVPTPDAPTPWANRPSTILMRSISAGGRLSRRAK